MVDKIKKKIKFASFNNLKKDNRLVIKLIIGLIIIGGLLYFLAEPLQRLTGPLFNKPTPTPTMQTLKLPNNWSQVKVDDERVLIKLEKKVNEEVIPSVGLTKSKTNITDPKTYVDDLISGTLSSMPNLVYEKDTTIKNKPYSRYLDGYYYINSQKINIIQQITINNNTVYTLTASFSQKNENIQNELNSIFKLLEEKYIK